LCLHGVVHTWTAADQPADKLAVGWGTRPQALLTHEADPTNEPVHALLLDGARCNHVANAYVAVELELATAPLEAREPSDTLKQAQRRPWQLVVDDDATRLVQVDALRQYVGRDEDLRESPRVAEASDQHVLIVGMVDIACDLAVNPEAHAQRAHEPRRDPAMEAEDQRLPEEACGSRRSLDDHLRVGEQPDEAIDASVVRREPGRGVDGLLQVRGMKHAIAESE
jgi:hypothetical protein